MASKTTRKAAAPRSSAPAATPSFPSTAAVETAGFTVAQEQLRSMISLADVIFKSAEELRRCQMEAAQQARRRHERAQADVAAAASPTELLNVQSELLRYDLESAGEYWQRLLGICRSAQAEAVDLMSKSAAGLGRAAAPVATAAPVMPQLTAMPGAQDGLDPSQAWSRWVDLGKQWNDMLYRTEAALH
jgi:phasin family protein